MCSGFGTKKDEGCDTQEGPGPDDNILNKVCTEFIHSLYNCFQVPSTDATLSNALNYI